MSGPPRSVVPVATALWGSRIVFERLQRRMRHRGVRLVLMASAGTVVVAVAALAAPRAADTLGQLPRGNPALLLAVALLSLLGYVCKAYGWRHLIAEQERPLPLALAAASGGACIVSLALPGRLDDVVRIALVRRLGGCPADVRTLCLSLVMLGLIDTAALAPLAFTAAVLPGHPIAVHLGLALIACVGLAAAAVVLTLPRLASSRRLRRFRLGRWLDSRTTPLRDAWLAWALVSASWLTRVVGLLLLLGALGLGFSVTLALFLLCAGSAAAALPVGPGGTANQIGAGSAVLIASGVGVPDAVAVAVAIQAPALLVGSSILLFATAWRIVVRLAPTDRRVTLRAARLRLAGEVRS